ncbi:hypothetical protein HK098_001301 [Nowakowskiella sp. JEL0407]|nr:hypothetical protein HK098_001301 [Nowakowskiella sp. JEL0407]
MTKANQKAYLDAVNCLNKKQAISTAAAPGARTRFDDFCGSHIRQSDNIHGVGHFLPWHRMYVAMFEEYLAAECGYTDGLPYWDWSLDSDPNTFAQSPIFASDAFGGNGPKLTGNPSSVGGLDIPNHTGGGCVQDGAFKDMVVSLGPGASLTANPRCLSRDLVPRLAINFQQSRIDKIMASTSFVAFDAAIEPAPPFSGSGIDWDNVGVHGAGHYSIGGSFGAMGNAHSSCGDPTFFLHHGNMDRLWWLWQLKDSKRLTEIGGKTMQGTTVTLDFKMDLNELTAPWPDLTVREFMNIKGGPLCYDYE